MYNRTGMVWGIHDTNHYVQCKKYKRIWYSSQSQSETFNKEQRYLTSLQIQDGPSHRLERKSLQTDDHATTVIMHFIAVYEKFFNTYFKNLKIENVVTLNATEKGLLCNFLRNILIEQ